MRIAAAQINVTVGDLRGNTEKISAWVRKAREARADVVAFPELSVTGYPPEDLLLKPQFIRDADHCLDELARETAGITAVIGYPAQETAGISNAAAVISDGTRAQVYRKVALPNYGVFDEQRYFIPGHAPMVTMIAGVPTGIAICEDIWNDAAPVSAAGAAGARVILALNASPYHAGKVREREEIVRALARKHAVYLIYVNLVGGQDELVFDGYSMAVAPDGTVMAHAAGFEEELLVVDLPLPASVPSKIGVPPAREPLPLLEAEVYQALQLGVRDYVRKNGFSEVLIGLSGGIDSALVAAIAADALGPDKVHGVFMPSEYSSEESRVDAYELAKLLGISCKTIPIAALMTLYTETLAPQFAGRKPDITEENLQARIRGTLLMALSNKFGWLVLTTGNKSEMSTGYATLYGDMAGGFAVIKDVPKMLVYRLCAYRNTRAPAIPQRVMTKEPTAELRPNQKDSDSLPPYPVLDQILKRSVEDDQPAAAIVAAGFPGETVQRVLRLVDRSEYKRRQSPPGIKITPRAFGRDRRMPITNRYTETLRTDNRERHG
jgi:NAD+ synthase (glutamine-hydrolysing)